MKSNIKRFSTIGMSKEEWLTFRENGVGGSESGIVLGLSPYKSSIELFYEKLTRLHIDINNEATHFGKVLEDVVADQWEYWEGTPQSMIDNYNAGKRVRKSAKVNAYLINPEHDHLFASLDRVMRKGDGGKEGVLEVKTISGYALKQWEHGIPPSYIIQLQHYLLVTELEHGEIAMLKDGRFMEVLPFERNDNILEKITRMTKEFWERVIGAREVLYKHGFHKFSNDLPPEILQEISLYQPEPDGSEAYEAFLNKRWTSEPGGKTGTDEQYLMGMKYLDLNQQIKVIEEKQRELSNKIKSDMGTLEELTFGAGGKITWKTNAKGTRTFLVSLKELKPVEGTV